MKIVNEKELEELDRETIRGGVEGVLIGAAISLPISYALYKRSTWYRKLPTSLKVLIPTLIIPPVWAIQTERRALQYDEERYWKGTGKEIMEREKSEEELRWQTLTPGQKLREWTVKNQFAVLGGGWALSMAVAGAIIARDKHQTGTQKIVQVRMWAQGLTVGLLIGAGILTQASRKDAAESRPVDHSWREVLEVQRREEEALKIRKNPMQPAETRL